LEIQLQTSYGQNEKKEVDTLSELVKAVRSLIKIRIGKQRRSMSTKATSAFKYPEVSELFHYSQQICGSSCR
jgi:hypothetical protein